MAIKKMLSSEKGVAILMVITTISILTLLMFTFRYETSVNKIKAYNITGKSQARINAESGLHLAFARLEIYQNALNTINKNSNLSKIATSEIINQIWSFPLKFPIPVTADTGLIDKNAIQEFEKNLLLNGEVMTTIESIGNKVNLNFLRFSNFINFLEELKRKNGQSSSSTTTTLDPNGSPYAQPPSDPNDPDSPQGTNQLVEVEKRLKELIENALLQKRETDSYFYNKYSGIDIDELIASIKYYISDEGTNIGPLMNQVASDFEKLEITPKFAPMTSVSELNLLPIWNDELIGLIKNEITVHGDMVIDVNKITANLLRLIVPEITDDDIKTFYDYKNNPEAPVTFESEKDLINYFADEARIIAKNEIEDNIDLLKKAGITFGAKPSLFKIISTGISGNSRYTINAIVTIPQVQKPSQSTNGSSTTTTTLSNQSSQDKKMQYSRPKVLEIFVN